MSIAFLLMTEFIIVSSHCTLDTVFMSTGNCTVSGMIFPLSSVSYVHFNASSIFLSAFLFLSSPIANFENFTRSI